MPPKFTATARLKRLGSALRALRAASDMTVEQAATSLGWSSSKVSRIENAKHIVSPDDVRALVTLYGLGLDETEKYAAIARQARQRDWWHKYDDVLPEWFEGYLGLEAEASKISTYESDLVPGLLQTEQYAAAVLGAYPLRTTPEEMERSVDLRRARQDRLSGENPLTLEPSNSADAPGTSAGCGTGAILCPLSCSAAPVRRFPRCPSSAPHDRVVC